MDKDFFQNIPMTQTERITMASRPKQPKYARNKNILVIGGSGSGKTRFFCKPSLLQAHSSYVCTDPKGTLLPEIGTFLERKKYRIKCLNLINFRKSMKYNPLTYIRSEKDILKLVNALIMNTKGEGEKSSEDFWVKAERLYYSALIGYIWYEATEEEKNFITLSSPEIENIFENSDFVYLLNQASGDRKILCERLNISTQQAAHISNAGPGEGLIFFGNVILPFVDHFPQNNELYSIMTTKLGETGKGGTAHE